MAEQRGWKDLLGRVGLVGKGVVATVVGLLAIRVARGEKGEAATNQGAVEWVAQQPFGKFLLLALTVALFALAAWRFLDAVMGDPVEGSEPKDRLRYAGLGVVYLSLAVTTLGITIANWTESDEGFGNRVSADESTQKAASTVFDWPLGRWLVAIGGVAVIGYAIYNAYQQVIKKTFTQRIDVDDRSWIVRFGQYGYLAQSLVYAAVGYFFVQAAITFDADTAKGPSGALLELADEGWGQLVLWLIAVGLFAYGVFCLAEARFRRLG
jgi:hypothetical protein